MEDHLKSRILLKSTIEYVGPFGTGKTTSLEKYFKEHTEFAPIWFNAFQFDFSDSPKVTFINELVMNIYKLVGEENRDKAIKAMKLVQRLIKGTVTTFFESKGVAISEADDEQWKEAVRNYEIESKKITKLKELLNGMASSIEKDIVIIIDDLDRARPDFALEIIEIAKHIFDVPNITIIFVYDRQAMNSIAAKKYGTRQGERYLDKYIHETFVHDDTEIFSNLNNYYFMIGFRSIFKPSARQLAIFDEKYGLKYNAVTSGINTHRNDEDWIIVKGALTAIRISNPELLKIITPSNGTSDFKNPLGLYNALTKKQEEVLEVMDPSQLIKYNEFINSLNPGVETSSIGVRLAKYINNMPLKSEINADFD